VRGKNRAKYFRDSEAINGLTDGLEDIK